MAINISHLERSVRQKRQRMSPLQKFLCDVFRVDTNYSLFIAGIVASVPATLLLNLVTFDITEVQCVWAYGVVYLLTFAASLASCFSMFRFAVRHIEVRGFAAAKAHANSGTEEEFENELVLEVARSYPDRVRPVVYMLLGSMGATVVGILALFVLMNIKF